jgi:hypothetical protein
MAHERLRSLLKLPDELAAGMSHNLAREAVSLLDTVPREVISDLFAPYDLRRLPSWSRQALEAALNRKALR